MSLHSAIIQKLLSANAHVGRHVTSHHFKIFSAGTRNSLGITDADKTLIALRGACGFLSQLTRLKPDSRILFVNTNPLYDEIISQTNKTLGFKNDASWRLGGFLTNGSGPRKFRGRNKKFNLNAAEPPDCIVILDAEEKRYVVNEANKLQIPVVGLVGSDVSLDVFRRITYPVPGNGDSVEFVYMFCNLIAKTVLKERDEMRLGAKDEEKDTVLARESVEPDEKSDKKGKKFVFAYENLLPIPDDSAVTKQLLDKLVVLKYNGNTVTDGGFNKGPRSVLEIIGGMTCLDLLINQIEALNAIHGCNIPMILVNASSAHNDIMKVLEKHPSSSIHSVLQCQDHIESDSDSTEDEDSGDEIDSLDLSNILLPLMENGKLDTLLSQGKEYILLLGSDNLSHVVDTRILNHLIWNNVDVCLEMLPKPSEVEEEKFGRNVIKILTPNKDWKFTDMMWMNINFIETQLSFKGKLSASKHFALSVPKSRYLPVQKTSDLLALQSDLYKLIDGAMTKNPTRVNPVDPPITLGPKFENVDDFRKRFKSIPSIIHLDALKVKGDVWFGDNVTLKGKVSIIAAPGAKIVIPDGTVLEDKIITRQEDIDELP